MNDVFKFARGDVGVIVGIRVRKSRVRWGKNFESFKLIFLGFMKMPDHHLSRNLGIFMG